MAAIASEQRAFPSHATQGAETSVTFLQSHTYSATSPSCGLKTQPRGAPAPPRWAAPRHRLPWAGGSAAGLLSLLGHALTAFDASGGTQGTLPRSRSERALLKYPQNHLSADGRKKFPSTPAC